MLPGGGLPPGMGNDSRSLSELVIARQIKAATSLIG